MSAKLFSLKGKVVVITGATRGLGEGMAVGLAEAGAELIIVHRPSTDATRIVSKLQDIGATVHALAHDASDVKNFDHVLAKSLELSSTGEVDVLVNNAGIAELNSPEDHTDEQWDIVLKVNLEAPFKLARAFGRHWIKESKKGKIINTGSLYSFIGGRNCISYTASKGGVHSITQALSNEWASKGINVNTIVPGYITTDMTRDMLSDPARGPDLLKRIPIGRFGDGDDFKGPTVFLASAASDYLTGGYIAVDGGFMAA
jgi:2-deoxy-D-gluconate 3-dehydrogenase